MISMNIALVGNPNCGKTTLFNCLTGKQAEVGNWSGVTVEQTQGGFTQAGIHVQVVDLPGCYQYSFSATNAIDEQITAEYLASKKADLIINVIDATTLKRHLYLTLQLLERGLPVVIALNMMDAAAAQGIKIDLAILAKDLGCPIIALAALKGEGVVELKAEIIRIQNDPSLLKPCPFLPLSCTNFSENAAVAIAKARYAVIHTITLAAVSQDSVHIGQPSWTEKIDKIVLNRFLGIPIFLISMYLVFVFAIHLAGVFQDFFDIASRAIFIDGLKVWLEACQAPNWLVNGMALGFGQGINTTVSFIPVITGMFFALALLEASGYMARAAFVMDKIMQWVGLPGKSFVPMIIGFGCNVPAVMATRTLENYRERILTILMSPFMSCGARLAIYALFVSAFFPQGGQNIIFALYLIGIAVALLTGFVLRTTLLQGSSSVLMIELPPYRWPSLQTLLKTTYYRLKHFLLKAGLLIVPLCMIIALLGAVQHKTENVHWLTSVGQNLTPLFSPMGIQKDNWPATVGLLTGVLAKEVVVGTLNAFYSQEQYPMHESPATLQQAIQSISHNWSQLIDAAQHPLLASVSEQQFNEGVLGTMVKQFGNRTSAFSYLLFILLYFPCISVVATIAKELNRSWAAFSVLWTTGIAYSVAVLFYQSANIVEHPVSSLTWIMGISSLLAGSFCIIRKMMRKYAGLQAKPFPTRIVIAG